MRINILLTALSVAVIVATIAGDGLLNRNVSAYNCGYYCSDCSTLETELRAADCSPATHFGSSASCYAFCPF